MKVFFGACAGVGKTYAMLQEAQRLRAQGLDVLVGVVETHGRSETAALLDGLTLLPQNASSIAAGWCMNSISTPRWRHPALVLMDELAHSNAHGSRHPKRWQDVEELLDAGIDVLTTVNVQHLESLNDVVGGVTGVRVRETVPDHVFDEASEVVLVDLPPDDLRRRLHEGKVYIPGQAERAIEHFFRKGNLIALRELALRRTADRVDDQMREFRDTQGRESVAHPRQHSAVRRPQQRQRKLVRIAARLAARLGCHWHAVYVETPSCTGCRKTSAAPFCARCGWRRNWEQKPPRWPILPKSARCCATPASITSAKSSSAAAAAALEAARQLRRSPRPAGAGSRSGDRGAGERHRTTAAGQGARRPQLQ